MAEPDKSRNDVPFETSIPTGEVPLESILCTEELRRRPWRAPDYQKENRALVALASALADSPHTILQTLAETILEVTQSDSSGVSLLTADGKRFYWPALAGIWKPHTGGGTPRDFGPCGDVLDRNMPLLMRHWEWRYTYFSPISPPVEEGLLVPFYVGGKAVGTIWVVMHDDRRKFDAEDERLLIGLGKFASTAYQALASIDDLKFQIGEREKAEAAVRELANGLETQVRARTQELERSTQELLATNKELQREIADREQAEEALRRSEAYLREAQALTHTGSWAWRAATREVIHWSEECFRLFGFDPKQGLTTWEEWTLRIHPEDRDKRQQIVEQAIRQKSGYELGYRIALPDGVIRYIHAVAHPTFNTCGGLEEFVGTSMDVTERRQAEDQLQKAFDEIKKLKDQLFEENIALKQEIDHSSMFEEIIGSSEPLSKVLLQVARVAPTDSTVLISGETGTGKELIARAIHKRSNRSKRAFISMNCAAIPPSLMASELFGHEKGAFTGALQRRLGRFELADGGTIFLDEIGELPPDTQIALLRVLQEREFERVGSSQPISVDVRVLAATNRDLKAAVAAGTFRQDLFYRLNVFPIQMPPLRERVDDIPLLVEYLIERYSKKAGKKIKNIQRRTLDLFQAYDWPGNIRELQNVVERAVVLCDGETFSVDEAWLNLESNQSGPTVPIVATLAEREREMIEVALAECKGRISGPSGAAAKLGIPRQTLDSKIRALQINKYRFKTP